MAKQQGFVLYFDDLEVMEKHLDPSDAFAVIMALSRFAQNGDRPADVSFSPAAAMAFELMAGKVERALQAYAEKSDKTRRAARSRWNANATESCERMQAHADASNTCECMQMHGTETELETEPETYTETEPETEQEQEKNARSRAEQLVRRYKLPDNDTSVEAVLEDIDVHGEETVETALKAANISNSRPMLSVGYYRAVLKGQLTGSHGRGDIMRHSPEDRQRTWSTAVVDLDAVDV